MYKHRAAKLFTATFVATGIIAGMPAIAQYLGEALPITHFIRLTRGIMLREASLGDMPFALAYLGMFAVAAMTAAALRFSKRLD